MASPIPYNVSIDVHSPLFSYLPTVVPDCWNCTSSSVGTGYSAPPTCTTQCRDAQISFSFQGSEVYFYLCTSSPLLVTFAPTVDNVLDPYLLLNSTSCRDSPMKVAQGLDATSSHTLILSWFNSTADNSEVVLHFSGAVVSMSVTPPDTNRVVGISYDGGSNYNLPLAVSGGAAAAVVIIILTVLAIRRMVVHDRGGLSSHLSDQDRRSIAIQDEPQITPYAATEARRLAPETETTKRQHPQPGSHPRAPHYARFPNREFMERAAHKIPFSAQRVHVDTRYQPSANRSTNALTELPEYIP